MAENLTTKFFNNVRTAENILGIYRNYFNLDKRVRCFVIIRVLVVFTSFFIDYLSYSLFEGTHIFDDVRYLSALIYRTQIFLSNFLMIINILRSHAYSVYFNDFMAVNKSYGEYPSFQKCLKKINFNILASATAFLTLEVAQVAFQITVFIDKFHFSTFAKSVSEKIITARLIFDHIILYANIQMLSNFVKCLNTGITGIIKKYDNVDKTVPRNINRCTGVPTAEEMKTLSDHYKYLVRCSKYLSTTFYIQVIIF